MQRRVEICEGAYIIAGGDTQRVSGVYYDTLKTITGCDSIIQTNLTVNPRPEPRLGENIRGICSNESRTLAPGNFAAYQWQDNSTGNNFSARQSGTYWVRVTNEFGCTATDTMQITSVWEAPADFLPNSDSICSYGKIVLNPTGAFEGYRWSSGANSREITIQDIGIYKLTVTDSRGCTGSDSVTIFSKECMHGVFVPDAFTPNNDGLNDRFKPLIFGNILQFRLLIFDRWGGIVFQTTEPQMAWDGTFRGQKQNAGTYIWMCSYQLEGFQPTTERGNLQLIR
jgi:gliding motility-associated-like protein